MKSIEMDSQTTTLTEYTAFFRNISVLVDTGHLLAKLATTNVSFDPQS